MTQKISIGRIVVAVIRVQGELVERPAIITRTWGNDSTAVQALVFPDFFSDGMPSNWPKSSMAYDESGLTEDSWHWPIRELPPTAKQESRREIDWVGLYAQAGDLCVMIERLPASGEATNLSIQASSLLARIREVSKP